MSAYRLKCEILPIIKTKKYLPPLNINLPVNLIKRWLIHGRCFNSLYDTRRYSIKIK